MATAQQELRDKVLACGDYHLQLVSDIAALDHASSSLERQNEHLADLKQKLVSSNKKLRSKEGQARLATMDHKDMSKSRVRRFFGKDKFEKKAQEAERKWQEAVQAETTARDQRDQLQKLQDEALVEKGNLEEKVKKHEELKKEQQALVSQLFDGPTPAFPQEDLLENSVKDLHKQRVATEKTLKEETKATDLLEKANASMNSAVSNMQDAITFSMMDITHRGGGNPDLAKRTSLKYTTANITSAKSNVQKAIAACPRVQPMPDVVIAGKSYWSDVFFDNVASDMSFHTKIKESASQVQVAQQKVRTEYATAAVRKQLATEVLNALKKEIEEREVLLFNLRKTIIDAFVKGGVKASSIPQPHPQPVVYVG